MDPSMIIEFLKAFFFGIVEGITEWLPISSTGHMMLLNQFVSLDVSAAFYDVFLVVIQLGAIMAVLILYFHKLNPFSHKKSAEQKKLTWGIWAKVLVGSIPAAIIGLAFDNWMEENVTNNPDIAYIVVSCALIFYGILFIIIELNNRRRLRQLKEEGALAGNAQSGDAQLGAQTQSSTGSQASLASSGALNKGGVLNALSSRKEKRLKSGNKFHGKHSPEAVEAMTGGITAAFAAAAAQEKAERPFDPYVDIADDPEDASNAVSKVTNFGELGFGRAFIIGIFQALAIVPGTSRSGSIIIGSMLLGCSRTVATEFAFFLAIPIMFGWSLLKFIKHGFAYSGLEWAIFAIGIVTAFVVSILSIKFLMSYIKKNDFTAFGVYRIVLGALVLLFFGGQAAGWFLF